MHVIGWCGVENAGGDLTEKTTSVQCWNFSFETSSVDAMWSMFWARMSAKTFGNCNSAGQGVLADLENDLVRQGQERKGSRHHG